MSTAASPHAARSAVEAAVATNSFCTLATSSAENRPHVAGVLYALVGRDLYVNMDRASRKARNISDNPRVAVCIPVTGAPDGPPFTVTLQGTAEILAADDAAITPLIEDGSLAAITSHGELERPGTCIVKVTPQRRVATYGVGIAAEQLAADPLSAFGSVEW
jgi:nitroimidazol reductase NimA-like FMN-containing flavoprotein (pyridoxamine 5'-phosphate oxidase superfamily)